MTMHGKQNIQLHVNLYTLTTCNISKQTVDQQKSALFLIMFVL